MDISVEITRRGFLKAILIAGVAPAFVRAESLMKIVRPVEIILPSQELIIPVMVKNRIFTCAAMSQVESDARQEGLVELRRYIDYAGRQLVDFALPRETRNYTMKLVV